MLRFLFIVVTLANPTPLTSQLKAPEARVQALQSLIATADIPKAGERSAVNLALRQILRDVELDLTTRVYSIRAMGSLASNAPLLFEHIEQTGTSEIHRVLGLESAKALARFAPPKALIKLLGHTEPEIRSTAARTGGPKEILCTLASADPWPFVRESAVYGLSASIDGLDCILKGLNDPAIKVRLASITVLSELAAQLTPIQRAPTISQLKSIVKDSHEAASLRTSAMSTLGALGDCSAAKAALQLYLKSNRLKVLLFESIGALQRCDELNPFLGQMLENKNDQVASLSLRLLVKANPDLGCRALEMRSDSFKARRGDLMKSLRAECTARVPLGERRVGIPDEKLDLEE